MLKDNRFYINTHYVVAWLTAKQTTNVEGSERLYNLELVDIEMLADLSRSPYNEIEGLQGQASPHSASKDIVKDVKEAVKEYFGENAPKDVVFYEFGVKEEDGFTGLAVGHDENHEVRPQLNPSSSEVTLGDLKRVVNGNNEGGEFSLDEEVGLKSHGPGVSDYSLLGEHAKTFREYEEAGLVYVDKADGKKKAILGLAV